MQIEHYLKIIDEIEKIRTKNNVNWMDVLRLAFLRAPEGSRGRRNSINRDDCRSS